MEESLDTKYHTCPQCIDTTRSHLSWVLKLSCAASQEELETKDVEIFTPRCTITLQDLLHGGRDHDLFMAANPIFACQNCLDERPTLVERPKRAELPPGTRLARPSDFGIVERRKRRQKDKH
jgi:hypothetical protein